ncbi:TOBE domain-containing protein [Hydrogenimonas sp.]
MNRLEAIVTEVQQNEGVSLVRFDASGVSLAMVGLEPPVNIAPKRRVRLGIKATHIALAASTPEQTTLQNALPVRIEAIDEGEILASIQCRFHDTPLEAIVPMSAIESLKLAPGDRAWALFLESEVFVLEIFS